ncbi:unnamed protein product, partial [Closterium sp. Yama58-4]
MEFKEAPPSLPPVPPLDPPLRQVYGADDSSLAMTRSVQRDTATSSRGSCDAPAHCAVVCVCSSIFIPPTLPQVYGPDDTNLALTRTVQRDIWRSQFPPGSCDGKRLLIVPWVLESGSEGLGSLEGLALQVHVMGAVLGLAVETGRVLVPLSGSFSHANNSACKAVGQQGQWGATSPPSPPPTVPSTHRRRCRAVHCGRGAAASTFATWLYQRSPLSVCTPTLTTTSSSCTLLSSPNGERLTCSVQIHCIVQHAGPPLLTTPPSPCL